MLPFTVLCFLTPAIFAADLSTTRPSTARTTTGPTTSKSSSNVATTGASTLISSGNVAKSQSLSTTTSFPTTTSIAIAIKPPSKNCTFDKQGLDPLVAFFSALYPDLNAKLFRTDALIMEVNLANSRCTEDPTSFLRKVATNGDVYNDRINCFKADVHANPKIYYKPSRAMECLNEIQTNNRRVVPIIWKYLNALPKTTAAGGNTTCTHVDSMEALDATSGGLRSTTTKLNDFIGQAPIFHFEPDP